MWFIWNAHILEIIFLTPSVLFEPAIHPMNNYPYYTTSRQKQLLNLGKKVKSLHKIYF
jgi:hypothetical protein